MKTCILPKGFMYLASMRNMTPPADRGQSAVFWFSMGVICTFILCFVAS